MVVTVRRMLGAIAALMLGWCANSAAQVTGTFASTPGSAPVSASTVVAPYTVRGRVLNGLDGNGVPRALVTLVGRRVLTDSQGNFQFDGFTQAKGAMTTTKPGFSATPDGSQPPRGASSPDLTVPVMLRLYPNAVITGVVSGRDGLPVVGVQVRLIAANLDITGLRWAQAGNSTTDSHGEYRFNVAPGRYRVSLQYRALARETGDVVMPVSFPEISSSDKSNYFTVNSGQERRIDLQSRTGTGYKVAVKVEPENVRNVRFSVIDGAGNSFSVPAESDEGGEFKLTLPSGSFQVKGHVDAQDSSQEGLTRVTVSSRQAAAVTMQLAPLTSLPVEIYVDPASTTAAATSSSATANTLSTQMPNPGQFNLRLHNERNVGDGQDGDVALTFGRGQPGAQAGALQQAAFRVPPGRYRLEGGNGGMWHVESATWGQTNLLGGEIVIGQGSGGTPIRLVVDNRTGSISGTVRMPDSVASAWVYLIAQTPSLSVANVVTVIAPGTFSTRVPIGSYNVMALDHQLHVDLRDPEVVKEFSTAVKSVEITTDATATIQLDLAREKGGTE